jgi:hypothetical protein
LISQFAFFCFGNKALPPPSSRLTSSHSVLIIKKPASKLSCCLCKI